MELALAGPGVDRIELVRVALTDFFHNNVSNHGAKAVAMVVDRADGSINAVWEATAAAGHANPASTLDTWTDKRHRIVHRGEGVVINRNPARGCVALVKTIGAAVDAEITPPV